MADLAGADAGKADRDWMDLFSERHAYRCLPMSMANCSGWEIALPFGFNAEWNGGHAAAT